MCKFMGLTATKSVSSYHHTLTNEPINGAGLLSIGGVLRLLAEPRFLSRFLRAPRRVRLFCMSRLQSLRCRLCPRGMFRLQAEPRSRARPVLCLREEASAQLLSRIRMAQGSRSVRTCPASKMPRDFARTTRAWTLGKTTGLLGQKSSRPPEACCPSGARRPLRMASSEWPRPRPNRKHEWRRFGLPPDCCSRGFAQQQ